MTNKANCSSECATYGDWEVHQASAHESEMKPAPWPHYPHCSHCHQRVVSMSPAATLQSSGRVVENARTFTGDNCINCGENLGRKND